MGRYLKEERDAHFQTLKLNNEAFRVNLSDMVSNNKKLFATAKSMADGVKSMASSTKSMAKSTETLAQTNQKIVDAHLSFLEEQRKK